MPITVHLCSPPFVHRVITSVALVLDSPNSHSHNFLLIFAFLWFVFQFATFFFQSSFSVVNGHMYGYMYCMYGRMFAHICIHSSMYLYCNIFISNNWVNNNVTLCFIEERNTALWVYFRLILLNCEAAMQNV